METEPTSSIQLPPGFKFHPSNEEPIVHYLQNKATSRPLPASVIAEVDLSIKKALFGEDDWYFFSPRNRKYPNRARPNRAAGSGYWKATGTDKPILTSCGSKHIGVKKALVFYTGRPSKGAKTEWIMNEYRLLDTNHKPSRLKGSMRLDDWVLCRVRQKSNMSRNSCSSMELPRYLPQIEEVRSTTFTNYNNDIITDFQFKGCQVLASILATSQALNPPIDTISCVSFEGSNKANSFTPVYGDGSDNVNYPTIVSSFDNNFNLLKRKSNVENKYEILLSKKKLHSENETEDLLHSKAPAEYDINCYSQNQSQDNFFNLKLSDTITNFQELNEFTFTEKYLQY